MSTIDLAAALDRLNVAKKSDIPVGGGTAINPGVYTLENRPSALNSPEGRVIEVAGLPIGRYQKAVKGNWVTMHKPVLLSTDWWTDSDDAVAMRILIHQERLGYIDLLGVAFDATLAKGPGSLEAFFLADGRYETPFAAPSPAHVPDGSPSYQARLFEMPHTVGGPETLETAVSLFRRKLAASVGKVDIIAIGYMVNLPALLDSPPDEYSPLTGAELVAEKVNLLWAMAGRWPNGSENNFIRTAQSRTSGARLCEEWPTPIVFLGWEVANTVISGGNLASSDEANGYLHMAMQDHGFGNGRASWDPMTVLLATVGNTAPNGVDLTPNGFNVVRGKATVDPATGANTWTTNATGKHYYVVKALTDEEFKTRLNSFLVKSAQPAVTPIVPRLPGVVIDNPQNPNPNPGTGTIDDANLVHEWNAEDVTEAQGVKVPAWTARKSGLVASTAVVADQPVSSAASDGKKALLFNDAILLTPDTTPDAEMTAYALVRWDTLYNQIAQSFATLDTAAGNRNWHLKTSAQQVTAATFTGGTGHTDNFAKPEPFMLGEWYVVALRRTAAQITAFLDGVSDGPSPHNGVNTSAGPISLGARGTRAEFVKSAHVRAIRVYRGAHDDSTIAAVTAQLKA